VRAKISIASDPGLIFVAGDRIYADIDLADWRPHEIG
jgi:hypothetical protein